MARNRSYAKRNKSEKIVCIVLVLLMVAVCAVMIGKMNQLEDTKTVGAFAFEIGGLDEQGKEIKNTGCIRLKKAVNVDGLAIKLDEEATVTYKVYYFSVDEDGKEVFISASEALSADFDASSIPGTAEVCKIVIEPTMDAEVSLFEINGYANQLTITYNK